MRLASAAVLCCFACSEPPAPAPRLSLNPGGTATVADTSLDAFGRPFPGMSRDEERAFFRGRALFRDVWVVAPASTESRDGLGPLFNARACEACHERDGRGGPPAPGQPLRTMLLRLSIEGQSPNGGPKPHPVYGGQLQPLSIPDVPAEGEATIATSAVIGSYDDGTPFELEQPRYEIAAPGYGPLGDVLISPRAAPSMIGLGLLSAIPDDALFASEDPLDRDGDGISGRVNRVWDQGQNTTAVGRFGWKSNQPSLRQQVAGAFVGDIGMTSSLFPQNDCTDLQTECKAATTGGTPELLEDILADVVFYSSTLAVPARRIDDRALITRGEELFFAARCDGCHTPQFNVPSVTVGNLGAETIQPFTDLLLHDMGANLADQRPDFLATGSEWRTAPLWGLGLQQTVNGHQRLLHDGRARGVAEAILWHGGEAEMSAQVFRALPGKDRDALIHFILSL